jgi:hypothetical protein
LRNDGAGDAIANQRSQRVDKQFDLRCEKRRHIVHDNAKP